MSTEIFKSFKIVDLTVSPHNVRFNVEPKAEVVEALADNIIAVNNDGRLINPLTVYESEQADGGVVAGKTRLLALQLLVNDGRLPEDAETLCAVVSSEAQAVLVSQSENNQRTNMHPLDECEGFQKLIDKGMSIESVALAFGQTARYIEGRLRLNSAAPVLLDGYRNHNFPSMEQLMALTLTDDHRRQVAVWEGAKDYQYNCTPKRLRAALTEPDAIDASTDRRIHLVSVAEYKAAGGEVQASLLTEHSYLLDPRLFAQLVEDKLRAVAADVQAEGWSWVEVETENVQTAAVKYSHTKPEHVDMTEAERDQLAALEEVRMHASEVYDDTAHGTDEEVAAEAALEAARIAVAAFCDTFKKFTSEQMAFGGAIVGLDSDGSLEIRRGLVRPADRRDLDQAAAAGRISSAPTGGRVTGDAGRPKEEMSLALVNDLRGLRIIAVQNAVAKNARFSKVLMALWAVEELAGDSFDYGSDGLPTDLSISGMGLRGKLGQLGPAVQAARNEQEEAFGAVVAGLPDNGVERWAALAQMSDEQLDSIIAHAFATSLCPSDKHEGVTALLLDAVEFDMAEHFVATPENFTSRVSKKLVVQALGDVGKATDAGVLLTMKKDGLADVAAHRLNGTGWVPELIRTPARPQKQVEAEGEAEAGDKAPAKKAAKAPAKKAAKAPAKKAAKAPAKKK
ncbi:ParB/RepB/Spo0J family partition protein [Stenotrophomonas maltophilia]